MIADLQRPPSAERLLDHAWAVDCAIRLRQPAWAGAEAESLVADLFRHHEELFPTWAGIDPSTAEVLAANNLGLRAGLLALADEVRFGALWPRAEVYRRVEELIHQEAVAAGDRACCCVD